MQIQFNGWEEEIIRKYVENIRKKRRIKIMDMNVVSLIGRLTNDVEAKVQVKHK